MKLQYLGTGAAEGWPGIFCSCPCCETARKLGGRNIRTRSQAVVYTGAPEPDAADMLLIDFPPDTYMHCLTHGLRTDLLSHLLITHSHNDHFASREMQYRMEWFADAKPYPLHVYGNETVREKLYKTLEEEGVTDQQAGIVFQVPDYYVPFIAGHFTVTALQARHKPPERCMLYIISDGQKRMLYAHDTGLFPDETWAYLQTQGQPFDLVSLDCTSGAMSDSGGHMGLPETVQIKNKLASLGLLNETSHVILNHFSHNGKLHYDAMKEAAAPYGLEVSFDGAEWNL